VDYVGERNGTLCDKSLILSRFREIGAYRKFIDGNYEKIKQRKDLEHLLLD